MSSDIFFINPMKENVSVVGMGQEGKTNFIKWLMSQSPNRYVAVDTIGVLSRNFQPTKPEIQQIIKFKSWHTKDQELSEICKAVFKKGNLNFIVDEIHNFCNKQIMHPDLAPIINMGGNRNIAYWFTSRRIAQVHNDIISQCKHHFIFKTYLPQDLEWYSTVVPKDIILMSKDLPSYHFIYYRLGSDPKIMKPVKDMG